MTIIHFPKASKSPESDELRHLTAAVQHLSKAAGSAEAQAAMSATAARITTLTSPDRRPPGAGARQRVPMGARILPFVFQRPALHAAA